MKRTIIDTKQAPRAIGPYVQAFQVGEQIFLSGQVGFDMTTKKLPDTVEEQMRNALLNIESILKAAGAVKEDVVKTTVFLQDMADFDAINKVYAEFFGDHKPARSCVAVAALPIGALVECECIAILDKEV
ncbi:MAG TPA: RidA family protein [Clostridiaceae bacterium]|nr:RidA family protein [Clostridiaceae bacterium]